MLLLISDANILIDMEAGELMEKLFQLPMQFAMPDILYWEEIEPGTPGLDAQGLQILEVSGQYVAFAAELRVKHGGVPSSNDYLALALAKQVDCPLLTGDQALSCSAVRGRRGHGHGLDSGKNGRASTGECQRRSRSTRIDEGSQASPAMGRCGARIEPLA